MTEPAADLSPEAAAMLARIRDYDWVSYVELERAYAAPRGLDPSGNLMLFASDEADEKNIFTWTHVNASFMAALNEIQPLIEAHPAPWFVYFVDGKVPRQPIAKRAVKYKKPHWLPVTFRMKGMGNGRRRPRRMLQTEVHP